MKWMQAAVDRMQEKGTVGSLTRMAKKVKMSPMAFARSRYRAKGAIGKKARFAVNANK